MQIIHAIIRVIWAVSGLPRSRNFQMAEAIPNILWFSPETFRPLGSENLSYYPMKANGGCHSSTAPHTVIVEVPNSRPTFA